MHLAVCRISERQYHWIITKWQHVYDWM